MTIRGLRIGTNSAGQNKTIEVIGDDFTLAASDVNDPDGSLYINDFSSTLAGLHVNSYHVLGNTFAAGVSIDISSGAGLNGPVTDREIVGNRFAANGGSWPDISFNGSGTGIPWFVFSVGGAVIKGNTFGASSQYIRARGTYDNSQFDWASYWNNNTYPRAAVVGAAPPADLREYSYPYVSGTFDHVRRIGGTIQGEVDHAAPGDTVLVKAGLYAENVTIPTPLTVRGAGQGKTIVVPAVSNPNPCSGSSLCGGAASNVFLVQANDVTITRLTVDGNNPALTSGIVRGGADIDARNGIITNHAVGTFNNLTVANVTIQNIYLRGVYASSGGRFTFRNNVVRNVQGDDSSIGMFNFGGAGLFANNDVSDTNDAISSNWSAGTQYLNNHVRRSASGVHTDNAGGNGYGTPDLIQGNTVEDCKPDGYGIWVFVPYIAPTVANNSVEKCTIGLGAFGGSFPPGSTVLTVFTKNSVEGDGKPGTVGAWVTTSTFYWGDTNVRAAFTGNKVEQFETGLLVENGAAAVATVSFDQGQVKENGTGVNTAGGTTTLTNSCVVDNGVGLLNNSGATAIAHLNAFDGNSGFSVSNLGLVTLDATQNWWGSPAGPGPGDTNGPVDTAAFLTHRPNGCDGGSDGHHAPSTTGGSGDSHKPPHASHDRHED